MSATARVRGAERPHKQNGRRANADRSIVQVTNSDDANNTTSARIQYLAARYGLVGSYATLIAALAFEGGRHV